MGEEVDCYMPEMVVFDPTLRACSVQMIIAYKGKTSRGTERKIQRLQASVIKFLDPIARNRISEIVTYVVKTTEQWTKQLQLTKGTYNTINRPKPPADSAASTET